MYFVFVVIFFRIQVACCIIVVVCDPVHDVETVLD